MSKLSISVIKPRGHRVELDGVDISHTITGLTVRYEPGVEPPITTLDLLPVHGTEVHEDVTVAVSDDTSAILTRLGWTPPADTTSEPKRSTRR